MAKTETIKEKNKYRLIQFSTLGGEFLTIIAPYVALGIANYDEWFNHEDDWKVGLGGILALAIVGITLFLIEKKKENEELTGGYIAFIILWFVTAFVFYLLASILDQIAKIMLVGGLGLLGGFGLNLFSNTYKNKADEIKGIVKEVSRDEKKQQYIKERQQEVVRVRIK